MPIEFQFEGSKFSGYQGDLLTSALWANDACIMGRSFKYHRPRSSYTLSGYDANVIVDDGSRTNLRGDSLLIEPGLKVHCVNTKGGVYHDKYRLTERFSRFMPVGFYYKAFFTPKRLFPHYERQMRKIAGLGRIHLETIPDVSPKDYAFTDVLVIGAGPTGLAAALASAELGLDVLVVDEQQRPGGSLCWQDMEARNTLESLVHRAESQPNLRIRCGTQAAGWYADQWVALCDQQKLTKLRTRATIFATGCIEQPAVFQNNDVPGVLLGSAAQRLINLYSVQPYENVVVFTANSDGYRVALDLLHAEVNVRKIVDLRPEGEQSVVGRLIDERKIPVLRGYAIHEAIPAAGDNRLKAVRIAPIEKDGSLRVSATQVVDCEGLVVSVGWAPNVDLLAQSGARFKYLQGIEQLIPHELRSGTFAAGRVNGIYDLDARIEDGERAGLEAARYLGQQVSTRTVKNDNNVRPNHPYPIFEHPGKKNFIDFDEDLHLADIVNSHKEGYDSVELLKRYSTVGMGPSQGKLSNMNAVRILARLNGDSLEDVGTTTSRPFHHPVSIYHLAGRRFHPHRHTPMHSWHIEAGANMIHVGPWFRPEFYQCETLSRDECILQEAESVRSHLGIIDISTLGKFLLHGPDAVRFLEQVYTGTFAKQKVGTVRYAMACDESGVVLEEGLVVRLAENRFYITSSSAGSATFYRELQRWALEFGLKVHLANVTGHWAAINLAGPYATEVLASTTDVELGAEFPFASCRVGMVAGVAATLMRVGFVGEVGYELHVEAGEAMKVWLALVEAGKECGIVPFGTEAQRLLRLEKGHLIAGHDTDALTNPFEAGLDAVVKLDKPFFVGKRSLEILRHKPLVRKLIGFTLPHGYTGTMPQECQLIIHEGEIAGRITSIAGQTTIGMPIGLAFVQPKLADPGTRLRIRVGSDRFVDAIAAPIPFYDPDDKRQI